MRTADAMAATLSLAIAFLQASDASEYLGNDQRTGYTDAVVPSKPALLWTYTERHAPKSAWPEPFGEL